MMALALLASTLDAHAQACVCSRNVALPSGNVQRAGEGIVALDYGLNLEADPSLWQGFSVVDRYGDSMAQMYMPPMLVHTGSLTATLGLPRHFSVSTTVPYMYKNNLGESEMPGDTDLDSFNDVDLTLKWGHVDEKMTTFYGASAGLTFPTGTVIPESPVRSGRGVFGMNVGLNAGTKVSPRLALAAQVSRSDGFGADDTGYVVAPNASVVAGGRWSPRENGRLNFALFALERWAGHDRQDALVYKNSGYLITDLSVASTYTFWEKALRSASFTVRVQAPVFQIVGDPMYAENFGGSVGVSVVAL
jgi:hypothetical protein